MIKKLTLLIVGLMLSASSHAQGTVTFANSATTLVMTNGAPSGAAAVGSLTLQMYYLPKTGTNPPIGVTWAFGSSLINFNGMEVMGATAGIAPVAGRFNAGTRTTGNDVVGGTAAWFQVLGWSSSFADPQSALNGGGLFGGSAVWSNPTGNPNGTPATNPQNFVFGQNGFNGIFFPVPEPSSIALGGLGFSALLLLRRRHRRVR